MTILQAVRPKLQEARELGHFFYTQRIKGFDPPGQPHLDADTAEWLEERLKVTRLLLEFGSGGSTVLANRLGVRSISVESDRYYAAAVRSALPKPELCQLLTPKMGVTMQWGMPVIGRSRKGERYVTAPFGCLHGEFPDLVLVDGRYRVACALETARRAQLAGATAELVFDDYSERPFYHSVERFLGRPRLVARAALFNIPDSHIPEDAVSRHMRDPR
jgi:hypothetical protein